VDCSDCDARSFCFRYLSELDAHPGRTLPDPALATCAWWKPSRDCCCCRCYQHFNRQMPPQPDREIPPKVVEPIEQVFRIEGIEGKAMP